MQQLVAPPLPEFSFRCRCVVAGTVKKLDARAFGGGQRIWNLRLGSLQPDCLKQKKEDEWFRHAD